MPRVNPLPPPPPRPQPVQYSQGTHSGTVFTLPQSPPLVPPPVPKKGGKTSTVAADVPGIEAFNNSIVELNGVLDEANVQLVNLQPVQAGSFYEGQVIHDAVNGGGTTAQPPLVPSYMDALNDLQKGFYAILDAGVRMAQTYKSANDLSNLSVTDVKNDMDGAASYISKSMSDNGGGGGGGGGAGGNNNGGGQ